MKVTVQKLFEKDIHKISDQKTARQIGLVIEEMEKAGSLSDLRNIKKMVAKGNYYRIRIGNYRLGFKVETDTLVLLRFMHRKISTATFPDRLLNIRQ